MKRIIGILFVIVMAIGVSSCMMMGMMAGKGEGDGKVCGMMQQMAKTGIEPASLPEPESKGAKIYTRFCSQCHKLPSTKRHSAKEWKLLVNRMDKRMRMMSEMKDKGMMSGKMMDKMPMMGMTSKVTAMTMEEKQLILGYLKKHSLPVISNEQLKTFNTPEAKIYKKICSQCHDLPPPDIFSHKEWEGVIKRMKQNMQEMNIPVMNQEEERHIFFLSKN